MTNQTLSESLAKASYIERMDMARAGLYLDVLYKDEDPQVREAVAVRGAHLEELSTDEDFSVRIQVARHGYKLERFVNDPVWMVRQEVAELGEYNHILYKDKDPEVRAMVAHRGEYLSELSRDEDAEVNEVARGLRGSTTKVIATGYGTYRGLLLLRMWDDRFEIISGCYETGDLKEWVKKCTLQLDRERAVNMGHVIADELHEFYGGNFPIM